MSIISQPFKIGIKSPELTAKRAKAATVRILKDVHRQYKDGASAWINLFVPKDTGELRRDMKQSTRQGFVLESDLITGIVLCLDSQKEYSQFVNDLAPPTQVRHDRDPLAVYNFFNAAVIEFMEMIPRYIKFAIDREESE